MASCKLSEQGVLSLWWQSSIRPNLNACGNQVVIPAIIWDWGNEYPHTAGICWRHFQAWSEEAVQRHSGTKEKAQGAQCSWGSLVPSAQHLCWVFADLVWFDTCLALIWVHQEASKITNVRQREMWPSHDHSRNTRACCLQREGEKRVKAEQRWCLWAVSPRRSVGRARHKDLIVVAP